MKTHRISKLAALAIIGISIALATGAMAAAARIFQTHVLVGHYPTNAAPGETVHIPVQLGYQDPGQGNKWCFLNGRMLSVNGYLSGGTMRNEPFEIRDVITGGNGQATISFQMPHKLRNHAGHEVGTALRVTAKFAGQPPHFSPGVENKIISIVVR